MIQKTDKYDIFKKFPGNREICSSNLNKLIDSIKTTNLLSLRPILVNSKMEVIDGQHRLEAAKALKMEVFYQVIDQRIENKDNVIALNANQKNWTPTDFLNFFCSNVQNENYKKLKTFMEKNEISLSSAIILLGFGEKGKWIREFKKGSFKYPTEYEKEGQKKLIFLREMMDLIRQKRIGPKAELYFLGSVKFKDALLKVFSYPEFDVDVFKKRIEMKAENLHRCSSCKEYLDILVKIYNFHNQKRIEVEV